MQCYQRPPGYFSLHFAMLYPILHLHNCRVFQLGISPVLYFDWRLNLKILIFPVSSCFLEYKTNTMQMVFMPHSDSLYKRVRCEPSKLSNKQISNTLEFFPLESPTPKTLLSKLYSGEELGFSNWFLDSASWNRQC